MKRYTLEIITGAHNLEEEREVIADWFEYSSSGCYTFYIKRSEENRTNQLVCAYPIDRTIIKKIEDVDNKGESSPRIF